MEYTVVIRTLGTAGDKYQQLLNSLDCQTIAPREIIVYIAEGYPLPKETIGKERYVYVKKGMVAQRALRYDEVQTDYMLCLDDDVFLPVDGVEKLYEALMREKADVISPDVFPNAQRSWGKRAMMFLSGRMNGRRDDGKWAYKVMRNSGYSYNKNPRKKIYMSQTNAGPCFFCKKESFLKIRFEEELWLDGMPYAMGEDEVMFYKMYLTGLKLLTIFDSGILHLDAGNNLQSAEKDKTRIYCDFRFKTIFWHRFIYLPEKSKCMRQWDILCIAYAFLFTLMISLLKKRSDLCKVKRDAIREGIRFIKSDEYKTLRKVEKSV